MKIDRHHPSRKFAPGHQPLLGVGSAWCALTAFAVIAVGLAVAWLLFNAPAR
jgi:hypothetical protein